MLKDEAGFCYLCLKPLKDEEDTKTLGCLIHTDDSVVYCAFIICKECLDWAAANMDVARALVQGKFDAIQKEIDIQKKKDDDSPFFGF